MLGRDGVHAREGVLKLGMSISEADKNRTSSSTWISILLTLGNGLIEILLVRFMLLCLHKFVTLRRMVCSWQISLALNNMVCAAILK
jgi:hypothetical protein